MSWQDWVDGQLLGTGKISKAAIIGQLGGVWAASSGYTLSTEEQNAIIKAFDPEGMKTVQSMGLRLGGQKFFTVRADERSIYLKKGADGGAIVKTLKAIVVAEYTAPIQGPEAATVVEKVADDLIARKN